MKSILGIILFFALSHVLAQSSGYPSKTIGFSREVINNNSFFYSKVSNYNPSVKTRYVRFDLNIDEAGFYDLYADTIAQSGKEDSFFVQVNQQETKYWNVPHSDKETRRRVENEVFLNKGMNSIFFYARESYTMIADISAKFRYYIEDAPIIGPKNITIGYPSRKSGVKYQKIKGNSFFYAEKSQFNIDNLNKFVSFQVDITTPGFYHMMANTLASNNNTDSFFVKINERFPQRWNVPISSQPSFKTVDNRVYLPKGKSEIYFYVREGFTKIADLRLSFIETLRPSYIQRFSSETPQAKSNRLLDVIATEKVLRASYEPFENGSRRILYRKSVSRSNEYTLSYRVKFADDFEFVKGGKLHGMGPLKTTTGCNAETKSGWSNRVMFGTGGTALLYIYEQDRPKRCGRGVGTKSNFKFETGRWYSVSLYTKLNSRGDRSDGQAKLYIDGKQVAQADNIRFRGELGSGSDIQQLLFSTFHGGSSSLWSPSKTVKADFDDFMMIKGDYPSK